MELVNLIAEIRQALGDDATHSRFVRTIHRLGYAFRESPDRTPPDHTTIARNDFRFRSVGLRAVSAWAKASTCWAATRTSSYTITISQVIYRSAGAASMPFAVYSIGTMR